MPAIQDTATLDRVTGLVERAAQGTDIEIVEVQLRGSGKARLLRIYIDKPGGVTHSDCELISERLGGLLDEEDVIPGDSYTLEVSSPGAERKLSKPRDFERVVGQKIRVLLREPVHGIKICEGKLAGVEGDILAIQTETADSGQVLRIPLTLVQKANLKFEW
jgi:ribosome maturation factor RimP